MKSAILLLVFGFLSMAQNEFWAVHEEAHLRKRQEQTDGSVTTKNIFGIDLLGWGVDIKLGKPEESIKVPIYNWVYNDGRNYTYPLNPEILFRVPDEVYVRTVAEMFLTSKVLTSVEKYKEYLFLNAGLSIKKDNTSSGGANSPSSNGTSSFSLAGFSGSIDVKYQQDTLSDNKHFLIINGLESGLYQLVIGPSIDIRDRVKSKIEEALNITTDQDLAIAEWINRHGTHYIESVIVGGKLEMSSSLQNNSAVDSDKLEVAASAEFNNLFGLSQVSVSINVTFGTESDVFKSEANNWMTALGGDPDIANFFSGNLRPNETFALWHETLITNPAVIRYRLRETSWLFPRDKRQHVSDIISRYVSGEFGF